MPSQKRPEVTPVVDLLVGGYCGSEPGYRSLVRAMHGATGNTTRFVGMVRFALPCVPSDSRYPRALYRQAVHLKRVVRAMYARGATTVRLYGHSMGGAVSLITADAFGALEIERVVTLNLAGIYVDGFMPLLLRMLAKGKQDAYDARHHPDPNVRRIIKAGRPGALIYLSNPLRSLAEGIALSRMPLFSQLVPGLAQTNTHVMVGYSHADTVFLPERVLEALGAFPGIQSFRLEGAHDVQYQPVKTVNSLCAHGAL